MAKPAAFLPSPRSRDTSVFRHGGAPREALWAIADEHVAGERTVYGAAILKARDVRTASLEVTASEPPPRHAAIGGWPWLDGDAALQKAQQKERPALASSAALVLRQLPAVTSPSGSQPRPRGIASLSIYTLKSV